MGTVGRTVGRLVFFLAAMAAVFQGTSAGPAGWFLAVNESRVRPLEKIAWQFPGVAEAESALSRSRAETAVLLLAPSAGSRTKRDLAEEVRVLRARGESCTFAAAGDWAENLAAALGVRDWGAAAPDAGVPGVYRVRVPGARQDLLLRPEPADVLLGGRPAPPGCIPVVKFAAGPGSTRRLAAFLAAAAASGIRFVSVREAVAGAKGQ